MYTFSGVVSGPIGTNCYTIINEATNEAVLIDASGSADTLLREVRKAGAKVVSIILTHAHFDHMDGVKGVKEEFPDAEVIIGKNDAPLLKDPGSNLSLMFLGIPISLEADRTVSEGDELEVIGLKFKCIEVPGHTIGGMCYFMEKITDDSSEENSGDAHKEGADGSKSDDSDTGFGVVYPVLFDGDTLFHGSVGRSDFPTGDGEALITNISEKLFVLPEETRVYPGHDSATTIGWEKKNNFCF